MDAERLRRLAALSDAERAAWAARESTPVYRDGFVNVAELGDADARWADAREALEAVAADALPELVSEVRRLRAEVAELSAEVSRLRDGRRGGGPYG